MLINILLESFLIRHSHDLARIRIEFGFTLFPVLLIILFMDAGRVVEFDSPKRLLEMYVCFTLLVYFFANVFGLGKFINSYNACKGDFFVKFFSRHMFVDFALYLIYSWLSVIWTPPRLPPPLARIMVFLDKRTFFLSIDVVTLFFADSEQKEWHLSNAQFVR